MIGCMKGGMNIKLYVVIDVDGCLIWFFMIVGQVSDYIGVVVLLGSLLKVEWLLVDWGYDVDWFCEVLEDKGIKFCILGRRLCGKLIKYDK